MAILVALAAHALAQQGADSHVLDPLEMKIDALELKDETLGDALGQLNQAYDISISIEGVLPEKGTIANPKFSARIENRTLADVLDWLCALDGRYSWSRDGNNVNIFPRNSASDDSYFFNRKLPELTLSDIRKVSDAVLALDRQSNDPSGGVIYMGIGQKLNFAKPWTATFSNITVRQALNRIARQLGPTYGWQIGGTSKAPLIVFHYRLEFQAARTAGGQ